MGVFKSHLDESKLASISGEGCMQGRMNCMCMMNHTPLGSFDEKKSYCVTRKESSFGNDRVSALPPAPSAGLANPPADWSAITKKRSSSGPSRHYREICIPTVLDKRLVRRQHHRLDDTRPLTLADTGKDRVINTVAWSTYRSRTQWTHRRNWTWQARTAFFKHRRNPNGYINLRYRAAKALMSRSTRMTSIPRHAYHIPPIYTWTGWTKHRRWRAPAFSPALVVVTEIC